MTDVVNGFLGGAGGSAPGAVDLADDSVAGATYAQWTLGFDGFTYHRQNAGAAVQDADWIDPQSGMDQYEARATLTSGDLPPGTFGSWLNLGSSWTWGWASQASPRAATLLIEIRRVTDHVVVDSATITLTVSGIL